jgi:DNA-binding transcriptional LysR family regulator
MDNYLKDMALFVEVVKAKGFRGAAEAVGIPNSKFHAFTAHQFA